MLYQNKTLQEMTEKELLAERAERVIRASDITNVTMFDAGRCGKVFEVDDEIIKRRLNRIRENHTYRAENDSWVCNSCGGESFNIWQLAMHTLCLKLTPLKP